MSSDFFKMLPKNYKFISHIFNIYMNKQDLVFNNQQRLICQKKKKRNNQPTIQEEKNSN